MKRALLMMGLAFSITLGIVFGVRASADALAVVLGVLLGVVASVPTTFLVTYFLTRSRTGDNGQPAPPTMHQPPVVVINAQDRPTVSGPNTKAPASLNPPPGGRQWTVIGDLETDDRE